MTELGYLSLFTIIVLSIGFIGGYAFCLVMNTPIEKEHFPPHMIGHEVVRNGNNTGLCEVWTDAVGNMFEVDCVPIGDDADG